MADILVASEGGGRYLSDVWVLDLDRLVFEQLSQPPQPPIVPSSEPSGGSPPPPPPPLPPCAGHAVVASGAALLVIGGHTKVRLANHAPANALLEAEWYDHLVRRLTCVSDMHPRVQKF